MATAALAVISAHLSACRPGDEDVATPASAPTTIATNFVEANDHCSSPHISADGTIVVFESRADNLIADDRNGVADVFRVELATGAIECVSRGADGSATDGPSGQASISGDGRRVAFSSAATNLVAGDANAQPDVFVRTWPQGSIVRVSTGRQPESGGGPSSAPDASDDGRTLALISAAANLVPNDTNAAADVFLYSFRNATLTRVSVASTNTQLNGPSGEARISGDGTAIAFSSSATDAVLNDTNGQTDVFVNRLKLGRTKRISVAAAGVEANGGSGAPAITRLGRVVAFESAASNLVEGDTNDAIDVFVHDLDSDRTVRISLCSSGAQAAGASREPAISADGRVVAFSSSAANLVEGDDNHAGDVFVHDRETGLTTRVSVSSRGAQGSADSAAPDISADGRYVVFQSLADNLVPADGNAKQDVFVHDRVTGETHRLSVRPR